MRERCAVALFVLFLLLVPPVAEAQALGQTSWWLMMTPTTTYVAYAFAGPFASLSACSQLQAYFQRNGSRETFTCQYGYNTIYYQDGWWVRRTLVSGSGGSWFAGPFEGEEDCMETASFMHATFENTFDCRWRP